MAGVGRASEQRLAMREAGDLPSMRPARAGSRAAADRLRPAAREACVAAAAPHARPPSQADRAAVGVERVLGDADDLVGRDAQQLVEQARQSKTPRRRTRMSSTARTPGTSCTAASSAERSSGVAEAEVVGVEEAAVAVRAEQRVEHRRLDVAGVGRRRDAHGDVEVESA